MNYNGLYFASRDILCEDEYNLSAEANRAALLTTGNGYMGVRASLEEYGSLCVQGCYIRGVLDEVVEIRLALADNLYMKKYYIQEDKLKKFEKQEFIADLIDFLMVRFEINGETFYPWEGKLISWKRWLDLSTGVLHRTVVWENSKGDQTEFRFERFASFADDHIYAIKARVRPLNYSGRIAVISGMDLRTKTNGQIITETVSSEAGDRWLLHEGRTTSKYRIPFMTAAVNALTASDAEWSAETDDDFVLHRAEFNAVQGQTHILDKKISICTGRDPIDDMREFTLGQIDVLSSRSYDDLLAEHLAVYQELMGKLDIQICGDDTADSVVRFSSYHTLISLERNDDVHSFSAKGLTGETYCGFVWWDAEIFQLPPLLKTMPELAKHAVMYRYRYLDQARKMAADEGRRGARYPFTAGVTGFETVWKDVRHPFMQVHGISDVALGVIQYFTATGDEAFLAEYGMEMLIEICRYWCDRAEWDEVHGRYGIFQVTGTDEHHPYVDNNAYTNYSVANVIAKTLEYLDLLGEKALPAVRKVGFTADEWKEFRELLEKLYLPFNEETGMIPQFDGYFDLSRELEVVAGTSKGGYTQMKQSGLYNKSQVIKQPDVLNLFAFQDLETSDRAYRRNFDYYEARCEAASSLSYCVHSICGADLDMPEHAYGYLMRTAELDLKDAHGGTKDGVHSGCMAGAWIAVTRGLAGMKYRDDCVSFRPHFIPWWDSVSFYSVWHGQGFRVSVNNTELNIEADASNSGVLIIEAGGEKTGLKAGQCIEYSAAAEPAPSF